MNEKCSPLSEMDFYHIIGHFADRGNSSLDLGLWIFSRLDKVLLLVLE
jgi:hypothetical protein